VSWSLALSFSLISTLIKKASATKTNALRQRQFIGGKRFNLTFIGQRLFEISANKTNYGPE